MRSYVLLAAAVMAVGFAGCRKGEPSPAYTQGADAFNQLYGRYLEDAYLRPEMDQVVATLKSVPKDSSDYVRAEELLKRIDSGRERLQAELAERQKMVQEAAAPTQDFDFKNAPAEADAGTEAANELPDAGPAEHPVAGMPLLEMQKRFGDCFLPSEDIEVRGRGYRPTWVLRETAYCLQHHPGYERKIVFGEGQNVLFIGDKTKVEKITEDAGVPASPPTSPATGADAG